MENENVYTVSFYQYDTKRRIMVSGILRVFTYACDALSYVADMTRTPVRDVEELFKNGHLDIIGNGKVYMVEEHVQE